MSQWSHLYKTRTWKARRAAQLQAEPLCAYCERLGKVTAATVADHIEPHKGDLALFNGELQSLCATCHSAGKQRQEHGQMGFDADGEPLEALKHWGRGGSKVQAAR